MLMREMPPLNTNSDNDTLVFSLGKKKFSQINYRSDTQLYNFENAKSS